MYFYDIFKNAIIEYSYLIIDMMSSSMWHSYFIGVALFFTLLACRYIVIVLVFMVK